MNIQCYWGLPSISADDGAGVMTNHLGYWRGFVWGPLSILTFWSLQEYDHVPEVRQGRKMMVDQLSAMMRRVWSANRHVCENFTPHKGTEESSSHHAPIVVHDVDLLGEVLTSFQAAGAGAQ